jgi:hypothetical protein
MLSDDSVSVSRSERVERRVGRVLDVVDDGRGTFEGDAGGTMVRFPRSFFWTSVMVYLGESTLFFAIGLVGGLQTKNQNDEDLLAQSQSRFNFQVRAASSL